MAALTCITCGKDAHPYSLKNLGMRLCNDHYHIELTKRAVLREEKAMKDSLGRAYLSYHSAVVSVGSTDSDNLIVGSMLRKADPRMFQQLMDEYKGATVLVRQLAGI